jgi:cytidylate kinase
MSIVAISETVGSLADTIGRELARRLGYEFMDREIIAKAAERFGESPSDLTHVTEERPTLLERFTHSKDHYLSSVEATVLEMAARDNVILCGRSAALALGRFTHVLRVRITASVPVRATRVAHRDGLTSDASVNHVRQADHERALRVRYLYHVDWDDPLQYDVTLNTERISVERAVALLVTMLEDIRYRATGPAQQELIDASLTAMAKATLRANPATRFLPVFVTCKDGHCSLTGIVDTEAQRQLAQEVLTAVPGVTSVLNEVVPTQRIRLYAGRT